jgi:hypothetical protein
MPLRSKPPRKHAGLLTSIYYVASDGRSLKFGRLLKIYNDVRFFMLRNLTEKESYFSITCIGDNHL